MLSFCDSVRLECEPDLADALVDILSLGYSWVVKDGGPDLYDWSSSAYQINIDSGPYFTDLWDRFCFDVKHRSRFFSQEAKDALDEILGPAIKGDIGGLTSAVRMIGGTDDADHRFVFRARLAHEVETQDKILRWPARELGPPPRSVHATGRMNAVGVPIFYGSFEPETSVAELRAPVGGTAIVGKFEIIRPLRVLDMQAFDAANIVRSYFDPNFSHVHAYAHFIQGFHEEIRKPVLPNAELLEYVPTQVVAEYLSNAVEPPIDAILCSSALTSPPGLNIAIFASACGVEALLYRQNIKLR
jgi:hypothetical protein